MPEPVAVTVFLSIYVCTWAMSLIWIAFDDDLRVLPSYLREVLWTKQLANSQEDLVKYGSRLVLFCLTQGCLIASIVGFGVAASAADGPVAIPVSLMVLSFALQYVWVPYAEQIRWRSRLRQSCNELMPVVRRFAAQGPLPATCKRAEYSVSDDWSAYHDWFQNVVPVAYVHSDASPTVLFPVDWKVFLAWHLPPELSIPGRTLPFRGPLDERFIVSSVNQVRGRPGWQIVHTEMESELLDQLMSA